MNEMKEEEKNRETEELSCVCLQDEDVEVYVCIYMELRSAHGFRV